MGSGGSGSALSQRPRDHPLVYANEAPLGGAALEHARRTVEAALATLKALRDEGWRAILGDPIGRGSLLGADAVAERSDPFDALSELSRPVRA